MGTSEIEGKGKGGEGRGGDEGEEMRSAPIFCSYFRQQGAHYKFFSYSYSYSLELVKQETDDNHARQRSSAVS